MQLLDAGYQVRTTVRSLNREAEVRAVLKAEGKDPGESLSFVVQNWPGKQEINLQQEMTVEYIQFRDEFRNVLMGMIKALYAEDPSGNKMNEEKIDKTIIYLKSHSESGKILLFISNGVIVGYSIIIYYWSNEYGGFILLLDELFVKEEYRNQGIGSAFISHLVTDETAFCKAIFLEVIPSNEHAMRFYNRIGFEPVGHNFQKYVLTA
jgi:GNAT superfamily N-acetyltransferase